MTLEEKLSQLLNAAPAIERPGIPGKGHTQKTRLQWPDRDDAYPGPVYPSARRERCRHTFRMITAAQPVAAYAWDF